MAEETLVLCNDREELRVSCKFLWADSLVKSGFGRDKVNSGTGTPANKGGWQIA